MADKPKLKETDEIMSSIGKKTRAPAILSTDLPQEETGPVNSVLDTPPRRRRRAAAAPPEEREDNNPLDIGKYDLKNPAPRTKKRGTGSRIVRPVDMEEQETPPEEQPVQEYQFEELSGEQPEAEAPAQEQAPAAKAPEEEPAPAPRKRGRPRKAESAKSEQAAKAVEMQLAGDTGTEAAPKPKRGRGRPRKNPLPEEQAAATAPEQPKAETPVEEPPSLLPPERDPEQVREDFRRMLASQFDEAFNERFESDGSPKKRRKADPIDDSWFEETSKKSQREALLPPEEEIELNKETEAFLQDFEKKVKEEESSKQESFKETLAQKFMRERERYLKELGVLEEEGEEQQDEAAPEARGPEQPAATGRKLDLQIQPEMHTGDGVARGPVTYGPGGDVRPMEEEEQGEPLPYMLPVGERAAARGYHKPAPGTAGAAQAAHDKIHTPGTVGKKTPEELLLELGAQNAVRGLHLANPNQLSPEERKRQAELLRKQSLLSFALKGGKALPPDGKKKRLGKKAAVVGVAAVLVLAVALGPIAKVMGLWDKPDNMVYDLPGIALGDDTLTVYESNNPEVLTDVGDILVKRGGISLSNYNVASHVIIGDIESQSDILLRDMTVGGNIYIQSCGVNKLRLENVTADRVVVSNSLQRVEVVIEGDTDVSVLEVRTPTTLLQQELGEEAGGVASVQAKQESMGILDIGVDGANLDAMTTSGSTILTLSGGSVVTTLSGEGTLNLSGDGRVSSLTLSPLDGEELSFSVKDVQIMSLAINGPAQAAIASPIDVLTVQEPVMLSGSGSINMLWAKQGMDNKRITVDLVGTQVNTFIADTEVLVNSDGDNRIGAMTANESVYTLGNPVGQLTVNHDRVIYENEPDKVVVKAGVRPPESVADNPNVDFTLSTRQGSGLNDASGDDVGTTCAHTRENGGFVYGDGSRSDPFQISSPAQLAHVAEHLDSHYIQTAHIDLSEDSQFASGFTPIGLGETPFKGTYDGGGYTISGLRINGDWEYVGLFAQNVGTVKNVHISGGEVRSTSAPSAHVGGVVAFNFSGGVVEACSNGARLIGAASGNTGGVVGYNFGAKVRDCYNYAKISGGGSVGGVVGANRDNASVVGSYNVGTVEDASSAGSVVGENTSSTVVNCYYLADTAEYGVGSGTGSAVQKSHEQMTRTQFARDLAAGDENTLWRMPTTGNYDYPILGTPAEAGFVYDQEVGDDIDDDDEDIPVDTAPVEVDEV